MILRGVWLFAMLAVAGPAWAQDNALDCWPRGKEAAKLGKYYVYERRINGRHDVTRTHVAVAESKRAA